MSGPRSPRCRGRQPRKGTKLRWGLSVLLLLVIAFVVPKPRLSSFNLGGAADKQGSGSGNSHSSGGSGSTLAGKSRSAAMERDRDLLEGQHSLGGTHLSTEDGAGDDDDLSDQPFEEVEEMDLPEARDDEQEDEEEQGEGLEPVQDVMDDLAQCQTLECLKPIHARLAGRTPFNLPHFFIVGWQKCATTSVVMHLRKHPQMLYSLSGVKESHYWSVCEKYPDKAICKVRTQEEYMLDYFNLKNASAGGLQQATADNSADYAYWGQGLAGRLHDLFPWLKIVIMMREPIARAVSYTRMHTQQGIHQDKGCHPEESLFDCLGRLLDPKQGKFNYSHALEGWLEAFPRDQVHIMQFEDMEERPEELLAQLKGFLGMDPALPEEQWRNVNNRAAAVDGDPMRLEDYETMLGWVRKDAIKVAAVLNKYGAADGDAFLAKWEDTWDRVREERCNSNGDCLINSH